jgi:hypothetical protein
MVNGTSSDSPLDLLKLIFADQPHLLDVVTLADLESGRLLEEMRERAGLLSSPVKMFVVGRTSAGKTSLGNSLFGKNAMESTGFMDCTSYIGLLRLKSNLWYFDTPGAGSDEQHENVTRLGLDLEQFDEPEVTFLQLRDFTEARVPGPGADVEGVKESIITQDQWAGEFADDFAPDVIVYVIAPHMHFLRQDRIYLRDMLERHRGKVLIAFNIWQVDGKQVTTEINLQDAERKITDVYWAVFPGGEVEPRFVKFNALTGSGIHELADKLCQVIPAGKLGEMQAVLTGDLKVHAQEERSRQYRQTVNRIAARLALHTVDQRTGEQDLISVAARAVSQYGWVTFEAADLVAQISEELSAHVESQVNAVKDTRQKPITTKDVKTRKRDIVEEVPIFAEVETETIEKQEVTRVIEETIGRNLGEAIRAYGRAARDHVKITFEGGDKNAHEARTRLLRGELVERKEREVKEFIDVKVRHVEKKVEGYEKKVVDTVTEVIGVTERIIGAKALQGGIPVIELLSAVGFGVEQFCTSENPADESIDVILARARARVRLVLNRAAPKLEAMLKQSAEDKITELLDQAFAGGPPRAGEAG